MAFFGKIVKSIIPEIGPDRVNIAMHLSPLSGMGLRGADVLARLPRPPVAGLIPAEWSKRGAVAG